ncbi:MULTISPECIES: TonB-dependent receptor plug domain-containing protein [unclassified Sphingobium]|uniref:TonB-dependent receptor plug domain-containing protein n=1 Tax=unclassified Sphingobium TaxID=2611147 RepID=UPI002224F263|nr:MULTISPECIES: TonB-dependent receptor [unclassified Sphingobium]MCW2385296.1 iron complex outermembrane receptor protein [Sphingobium sp. B2D3D]
MKHFAKRLGLASPSLLALTLAMPAMAQTETAPADNSGEADVDIVVTGVRGTPRTVQDSPVPIDHFNQEDIEKISSTDTVAVMQTLVPSLNVTRQPNSSTGTFVRPITLRGLPEDKTLLLMNSKRRHKSASVAISGTGAQGADSAVIPSLALKSVEVLRDGAAAQYGSDAIAGVINFMLKDDNHGGSLTAQAGQYYEGDGDSLMVAGNVGMKLTENGFVNVTAQYSRDDYTTRANQYTSTTFDARAYAAANPAYAALVDLDTPLQKWGQPKTEAFRAVVNSGIDISDTAQVYAFGNFSRSKGSAYANYRYPANNQPVNGVPVRLQDGSVFSFTDIFPAGFSPVFSGVVTDWSAVAGIKGTTASDALSYDISARYGWDKLAYEIVDTVNASLGPNSPRSFKPSTYIDSELALNADLSYSIPVAAFETPLVVSFGGEYRNEEYTIRPGELDSYRGGPFAATDPFDFCNEATRTLNPGAPTNKGINCANYQAGTADGFAGIDPAYNVLPVGSNGVNGVPPSAAGTWGVKSVSAYLELSTDPIKGLFVDLAGRFEHFSNFGNTVNGKAAFRYEFTPGIAMRGSIGTGFHAPSPGLINTTSVSIRTVNGVFTQAGLFPATNPVSQFLGAKELEPEKSTNYTLGLTLAPMPGLSLSLDGYIIKIRDAFYSTRNVAVTDALKAQMIAAGVVGADSIASVNFFQNAFDSDTRGFDAILTYDHRWGGGMKTNFAASFNANWYKIESLKIPSLFTVYQDYNFRNAAPRWRGTLSAVHSMGAVSLMARANLFGPYTAMATAPSETVANPTQSFKTQAQIDLEASYTFDESFTISVGARNILDHYPAPDLLQPTAGRIYRTDSVVDWQGGFYYARLNFKF